MITNILKKISILFKKEEAQEFEKQYNSILRCRNDIFNHYDSILNSLRETMFFPIDHSIVVEKVFYQSGTKDYETRFVLRISSDPEGFTGGVVCQQYRRKNNELVCVEAMAMVDMPTLNVMTELAAKLKNNTVNILIHSLLDSGFGKIRKEYYDLGRDW